jgi:hypothetical protein
VAYPRAKLADALRFLGQPLPAAAEVATMLRVAAQGFNLSPLRGIRVSPRP